MDAQSSTDPKATAVIRAASPGTLPSWPASTANEANTAVWRTTTPAAAPATTPAFELKVWVNDSHRVSMCSGTASKSSATGKNSNSDQRT